MVASLLTTVAHIAYSLLSKLTSFFSHVHALTITLFQTVSRMPLCLRRMPILIQQMWSIGIESMPLVIVTAIFLGAETVVQANYQFAGLVPMKYLGMAVCKGLINELGPVVLSLVVSGRVATAIAAEIGSMKATEQLDAMAVLSLDSARYLFAPKMIACILMLPVLVIIGEFMAILGSIFIVLTSLDVTPYVYFTGLKLFFNPLDLVFGILKTTGFGAIIAITGIYFGSIAKGGAEGVGNATTYAVMTSAVLILVFDFAVAALLW